MCMELLNCVTTKEENDVYTSLQTLQNLRMRLELLMFTPMRVLSLPLGVLERQRNEREEGRIFFPALLQ